MSQSAGTSEKVKKPRAPRASKNEGFMQNKLAQYKTVDPTCPDCWHAYKWAKADEKDVKKQQKDEQKQNQPPIDRIRQLLAEAAKRGNFADKLAEKPGKEKQSEGMRKSAETAMGNAVRTFQNLSPDERGQLDEQEQNWLSRGDIPALADYFDGNNDDEEAESDHKIQQGKQIEKLVQEREVLHRRLSHFERELAQTKQMSETMKQEINQLIRSVKDKTIKSRLQEILQLSDQQVQ